MYEVGNHLFKSKKAIQLFTRELLERRGVCEIDKSDGDFHFLFSLFIRRPSHQGKENDVVLFKINLDPIKGNRPNNLSYLDKEGNENVFSWNKCCDGRETKSLDKLKEACRQSVREEISDCWRKSEKCSYCNKNKMKGFEIDHINEFSLIFKSFMETTTLEVPIDFESDKVSNQNIFRKEDFLFEEAFKNYHNEKAHLQLLCSECHREKTKKFNSAK